MADALSEQLAECLEDESPDMIEAVKEELLKGVYADQAMAEARQRRVAEANARLERAWIDGLGECVMEVDLTSYLFWQMREPGCWGDRQFKREFMRDNPHVRVKSKPRHTTIVHPGFD